MNEQTMESYDMFVTLLSLEHHVLTKNSSKAIKSQEQNCYNRT